MLRNVVTREIYKNITKKKETQLNILYSECLDIYITKKSVLALSCYLKKMIMKINEMKKNPENCQRTYHRPQNTKKHTHTAFS